MNATPADHQPQKRLMKTAEVAKIFDVHPDTVREWARDGRLPSLKTPGGQEHRFRSADVEKLLNAPDNAASPPGADTPDGL